MQKKGLLHFLKRENLYSKDTELNLREIKKVKRILSIGGGPIGVGWTAHFLSKGFKVCAYLHSPDEKANFIKTLGVAWKTLLKLGLPIKASLDNLEISNNLEDAIQDVDFIQESSPEVLEIKAKLYRMLGEKVDQDVVIASSTSGIPMTEISKGCKNSSRMIVGHPFNPPYLLQLVEVVTGEDTSKETVQWIEGFYNSVGKVPLILRKEIPGFIATRLQEALWREALHMVDNNEATPADIDKALIYGPASRMVVQGICKAFHVACGEGGMATNLDQFGPALKLPWTRLEAPELTTTLRDKMVNGCLEMTSGKTHEELIAERDQIILGILNLKK